MSNTFIDYKESPLLGHTTLCVPSHKVADIKNMPSFELRVSVEHHHGTRRVYPECMKAQLFADLAGTSTLTDNAIDTIKQLGYKFKVEVPEL